jgi:hypothetical protein
VTELAAAGPGLPAGRSGGRRAKPPGEVRRETRSETGVNSQRILLWLIRKALPWAALLLALWGILETASGLLGKDSMLEVWIAWMGKARVTRLSAIIFGLAGIAYGLQQRVLRRELEKTLAECLRERRG